MADVHDQSEGFSIKKKVDESWKDSAHKEKEAEPSPENSESEVPEPNFSLFLSTLAMQSLIALGEAPHPVTHQKTEDLFQGKYLIDVLQILAEKTKGNLTAEEDNMLKNLLYELQMKFVEKIQTQGVPGGPSHE